MSFVSDRISTDVNESYNDLFSELVSNLSSHWNGRQITVEDAIVLNDAIQDQVIRFLFSQESDHPSFENVLNKLTGMGGDASSFTLADRKVDYLFTTLDGLYYQSQNGLVMQVGLGKFWQKHKKEIIIGALAVAVIVTVVVVTVATYGTGSPAATAAGSAVVGGAQMYLQDDDKKKSPDEMEDPSQNQVQSSIATPASAVGPSTQDTPRSYDELLLLETGVMLNGKHYAYWEFLQKVKQDEFFTNLLNAPKITLPVETMSPSEPKTNYSSREAILPQSGTSLSRKFFEIFGREVAGQELMADVPPSKLQRSHLFTTSGEQPSSSCQIGGINGINTSLEGAVGHADYIRQLTPGQSIDWVYNNSHGVLADVFLEVPLNYLGVSPNTEQLLAEKWEAFHKENNDNPKARYLQFCHSQGAIHVKNALTKAPKEIRNRVMVVAIAPAAVITEELCFRSFNYASKKDIVPFGEVVFAGFNEPEIRKERLEEALTHYKALILLEPHPKATGIDHDFQSPTFKESIEKHTKEHINSNGEYE